MGDKNFPDGDDFKEFSEQMQQQMENAERLGLEDFSRTFTMGKMKTQGIGFFYPALVDEDDNTKPNDRNGKYHMVADDVIDTMKWVERHLWQNRMRDFATGVMMFAANMLHEMARGDHEELLIQAKALYKKEFPDKEPNDFELAAQTLYNILEMLNENPKAVSKIYRQVLMHEEPELITIGDPRTVSSIIQGGYTSDTISKEEVLKGMKQKISDKDIEKFLSEVMGDTPKNEEE